MGDKSNVSSTAANDSESELIARDKAMQRAVIERDATAFADCLTDDYTLVGSKGLIYNKADCVAEVASPDVRYDINESSDWHVRVQGDVAVVIAILHQKGVSHGKPFHDRLRYTDTWVREKGSWRNVAAHVSRLPDSPAE